MIKRVPPEKRETGLEGSSHGCSPRDIFPKEDVAPSALSSGFTGWTGMGSRRE
jgi:hypothetical protein